MANLAYHNAFFEWGGSMATCTDSRSLSRFKLSPMIGFRHWDRDQVWQLQNELLKWSWRCICLWNFSKHDLFEKDDKVKYVERKQSVVRKTLGSMLYALTFALKENICVTLSKSFHHLGFHCLNKNKETKNLEQVACLIWYWEASFW